MNKIYNIKLNNVVITLKILAILAFGLVIIPMKANACGELYGDNYSNRPNCSQSNRSFMNTSNDVNYSANNAVVMNSAAATNDVTPTIYSSTTNPNTTKSATTVKTTSTKNTETNKIADDSSNLSAAVIFGTNSFMPSSLIQWIFFAILVLIVVILMRKVFGLNNKYYSTPLKHD
ncbi:hypothetical protein A3A05_02005 [Candidatus Nomurabacteria bacterium RIFCSPLOWO2_01_FULL_41_12]|uniref:Uncharacterized protein n=1 Tax=Candidatus Nomurabacteria bacterium RIFCSPLOWO2_01_FULL_41_12 TaxID=1801774 RepID=A0A1F6WX58_9BACT|nr:MAG: hypothetical protein A2732_01385 [Candidatus Nomurabacteria bacterium RIFCSPHIGHO2_01_FULL_40_10]OGI86335.1 MAG: hypothetical protein A3A05_02005 [Candidatus Nomurabacteria bacterium RIFCSPLOWO2_01_FULL_41_12]